MGQTSRPTRHFTTAGPEGQGVGGVMGFGIGVVPEREESAEGRALFFSLRFAAFMRPLTILISFALPGARDESGYFPTHNITQPTQ
jgi:hypothetical protein